MTPRFRFTLLAPITLGIGLYFALPPQPHIPPALKPVQQLSLMERYRVGHDWLETPPSLTSKARSLMNRIDDQFNATCQDKSCPTCQWNQLFGGEW